MMDCDTTGIEPEISLVKHKLLSGGGRLKIVNRTVKRALRKLGYSDGELSRILSIMEETGTIENIQELKPDHLPVFDCSMVPTLGQRFLSPDSHLEMMAAVQPFISGAISKTVNLPSQTTVDEVADIIVKSWRLGLKSVAVYRDGCKSVQPVGPSAAGGLNRRSPIRRRLPTDCSSVRHKFEIAGHKGYIHTGFYKDGKVGEIFIRMAKEGSTISGLMDTIATLTSIALQYGVPLEALVSKFSHVRFEPSGFTSDPDVPYAKSLTDYIFRYLGTRFLTKELQVAAGLLPSDALPSLNEHPLEKNHQGNSDENLENFRSQPFNLQSDAPSCHDCGAIMVRNGSCYKCLNCGATNGCS